MITAWTQHLQTDEEREKFTQGLQHSKWLFDRMRTLLDQMNDSLEEQELSTKAYDNANWQYRQADANGSKRIIRKIKRLIDLKE
jgi:hypothetical protein